MAAAEYRKFLTLPWTFCSCHFPSSSQLRRYEHVPGNQTCTNYLYDSRAPPDKLKRLIHDVAPLTAMDFSLGMSASHYQALKLYMNKQNTWPATHY